jgi:hypothetical protein
LTQAYQAYERLEAQLSVALDKLVATNGFADLLATSATNVMALTRLANGTVDRVVRTTRLAARHDVTELARQLARTEAKLERLLQVVESLQGQLEAADAEPAAPAQQPPAPAQPADTDADAEGEVLSAITAPSVTTPMEAPAEPRGNGAVRNGTALSGGTGRVRASRATATKSAITKRSATARTAPPRKAAPAKAAPAKAAPAKAAPASGEGETEAP